jgi:hypothetical protein
VTLGRRPGEPHGILQLLFRNIDRGLHGIQFNHAGNPESSLSSPPPLSSPGLSAGKVWRVGFLYAGQKIDAAGVLQPFLEGLRQLGYVEGKTLRVEVWATERHPEHLRALAAELVGVKADVIVVHSAGHAAIVQGLTKTLPIVTLFAGELVSSGIVATLAKPGGNVTGMQLSSPE